MAEHKIRNLNPEEIECRVGTVMEQGITLLLYKNARVDQTILDEVFGIYGWQRRHNMIGNELYCILSIWMMRNSSGCKKRMWEQKVIMRKPKVLHQIHSREPALISGLEGSCIRLLLFIFP